MRSFLTVAVSLACIQAISALPVYNLGGEKLHARQMSCNNMSGLIPLNLLGHNTCTVAGGRSAGPPPGAGVAGPMPVPTAGAGIPVCGGVGGAAGPPRGPSGGSYSSSQSQSQSQ